MALPGGLEHGERELLADLHDGGVSVNYSLRLKERKTATEVLTGKHEIVKDGNGGGRIEFDLIRRAAVLFF
jgi:hypothetical protein